MSEQSVSRARRTVGRVGEDIAVECVDGGRIEVWKRNDLFGVSLLPNEDLPGYGVVKYTSMEGIRDFPTSFDVDALFTWARAHWR